MIGWEPGDCAQAQLSSPKVTSANSDQPGIPCSPEELKRSIYTGMSSGRGCGKLEPKGHPNQFFLQCTMLLMLFFPVDFHRAMKPGQRKKNKQTSSTHMHMLEHTYMCSHMYVFTHTHTHVGVPEHINAHALPCMNIKAVHLASCPPPCLGRFLWLTPPVSKSLSQSTVVHPNFHGVSQD